MIQKKYAILFLSFISITTTAQDISFTDTQFEAKLLEASPLNTIALDENNNSIQIDSNNDGIIQVNEALQVIKLNVFNSDISSLDGIEFFTNMIDLICAMNNLESVVLPELPNLNHLQCQLNQLEVLDLSLTENLLSLDAEMNNLHTITFHPNSQLYSINLRYNNFVAFDSSGLSQLAILIVNHNSLEQLNVSESINLINLLCEHNNLTSLNLAGCPNLAGIICNNNQLTNLEINELPNLLALECQNNQLVQVDVSDSPLLEYVYLENNNLVELNLKNGANESASFSGNPNLSYICCDEAEIESIELLLIDWEIPNCTVDSNCTLNTSDFVLNNRFVISPNPVENAFSIYTDKTVLSVSLYDLNGRLIETYPSKQSNSYELNVDSGIYLVKVITTDSIVTQKILKE
ncbi:T9SS type A sorting domain-containing protein [Flavobacterium lacus]|uniref:Putative secreted protein (Por secretion system target) n=1 Tax=Flavobacterium lacus TaxID=1353778 RepID=A0A328WL80_9FLAO|nr:T9SS type A sorting domain-containing protein [Flavobacterium lacus]RAR46953.1 putative secreted protein (Por secretion system target) [Flavobacterium lacus]